MRKSSWMVAGLICVLAAVLICVKTSGRPQPSEEEQIHTLLAKGQSAIERKDLRDALSCVSREYSDSAGFTFETLRLQGAQAFREQGKYDVVLDDTSIEIRGETAQVEAQATVLLIFGRDVHQVFSGPLSISLRKEKSKRWLVFPADAWKVIRMDGIPGEFQE